VFLESAPPTTIFQAWLTTQPSLFSQVHVSSLNCPFALYYCMFACMAPTGPLFSGCSQLMKQDKVKYENNAREMTRK
jgi:hypothetical protein